MSSTSCPAKSEIQQIFKRLSSVPANKVCFDCGAKNPTWASVTYGIFICIDCSGIHRSLGVHLTFVRSTQLDSNWTWQQVRQMQLGGNANATTFFRQHNCTTNDAQQKYKSRAAQLYRDKLHHSAAQAMRLHGTKLFIDGTPNSPDNENTNNNEEDDKDFFTAQKEKPDMAVFDQSNAIHKSSSFGKLSKESDLSDQGPDVSAALAMSPTQALQKQEPRKSTIGGRKPAAKKGGLGAKKGGLGAQKVKKDFAEIEREAELADQVKTRIEEERQAAAITKQQDEEKAAASMRLAYKDLSLEQKKTEDKLRVLDPKKAAQVERLGMGVGAKSAVVSHSAITEMNTIKQEEPRSSGRSGYGNKSRRDYEDDYDFCGFDNRDDDWSRRSASKVDDYESSSGNWEKEFEVMKNTNSSTSTSKTEWNNNFEDSSSTSKGSNSTSYGRRNYGVDSGSSNTDEAQKKFGGAKAISSDMYFSGDSNNGPDANLSRFSGSASISSAEYFGRQETTPASRYGSSMNAPDMEDVKESVKQGVSKVAGRLSNMASGVMTQIQDRYGY